jgi:hypothetical protein
MGQAASSLGRATSHNSDQQKKRRLQYGTDGSPAEEGGAGCRQGGGRVGAGLAGRRSAGNRGIAF